MNSRYLLVLLFGGLLACSSGTEQTSINKEKTKTFQAPQLKNENQPIPNNSHLNEYSILIFGNSHVFELNQFLQLIFEHGQTTKSIANINLQMGDFLAERLEDQQSVALLQDNAWTHVILQAQKYSQSGQVDYPTIATQTWVQLAKSQQATPILFPEHPQKGRYQEGQRVHNLHVRIAKQQSSCVAPVGLVWDRVIALRPSLKLHESDGNHAAYAGRFLTALVFYEIISGEPADLLPFIQEVNVSEDLQDFFGQITSEVIGQNPPCDY